ncbi:MAG TPA: HEAT repeat domain-containing protein [Acidimicrobiales bacterium]|jgi:hypothetical protein|nr:HEAT repeat domain-containing protein [Acidimicrobiales bacterium]
MTKNRDFKRKVRQRTSKVGESYQAALGQMLATERPNDLGPEQQAAVDRYFELWTQHLKDWKERGGPYRPFVADVPVAALQAAALAHPNAKTRRYCLTVLDHEANELSVETFRAALRDEVPRVRLLALHGLACERCREQPLCLDDVVPDLVKMLRTDESPKVRHGAVMAVAALADRDDRVAKALAEATTDDADELVRQAAGAAAAGDLRNVRSRKAFRRRQARRGGSAASPEG